MSKVLIVTGMILVISIVALIFAYPVFKNHVGNLGPSVLPIKTLSQSSNQSSQSSSTSLNLPISLNDSRIQVFAPNIPKARDLTFSPNNTLLVSSLEGRVYALSTNSDGSLKEAKIILSDLKNPHGLAFRNGKLFVAEETSVNRYNWDESTLTATFDKQILSLPKGGRHFTRSLEFDPSGALYISLGSTCDVCFENNPWHGAVIITNENGDNPTVFSSGLRNAVFLTLNPFTKQIWATDMGRDFLGDNLPPDEIDILSKDANFGWPLCYGNKVRDTKFNTDSKYADFCNTTTPPAFELGAHTAPLGLTFVKSDKLPSDYQGDLLVALHGSWNSSVPVGYKIVKLDVNGNAVTNSSDFITGFIDNNAAFGRPVDVIFDPSGNLFFSDDKGGKVYKFTP